MHTDYRNSTFSRFRDIQVESATSAEQVALAVRAERLIGQLSPERSYSCDYLFQHVQRGSDASCRDQVGHAERIKGEDACHDLRLLIEDLSEAADIPVESASERVHTADELSKLFGVSTKTIARWRRQGLVGRRFLIDGRRRVGFLKSSVDRFVAGNRDRISRGSRFRLLSDAERSEIIAEARSLSADGYAMNDVAKRLAVSMERSPGTIRAAIKQYDRLHPNQAIFPDCSRPLNDELRKKIYQLYRNGTSGDSLAEQFGRTRTTIYRVVARERYDRIVELPLNHVANSKFPRIRNDSTIVGKMPEADGSTRNPRMPRDLPSYLASLYEVPLLTFAQEQHLFRKFNYLKYRVGRLREKLHPDRPQMRLMDEIEQLYDKAVATMNLIVRANLRLVVSIAKRHVGPQENFFELVSDGNVSLIRAVEKFDFARGFKFSTYASWAIMKNFARSIPNEIKQRERFRTSQDENFGATEERRTDWLGQELAHKNRLTEVRKILTRLDDREQKIIIHRFGLDYSKAPRTLKQVGEEMGVTKERVRQIEARALIKLRVAAEEDKIDLPETF